MSRPPSRPPRSIFVFVVLALFHSFAFFSTNTLRWQMIDAALCVSRNCLPNASMFTAKHSVVVELLRNNHRNTHSVYELIRVLKPTSIDEQLLTNDRGSVYWPTIRPFIRKTRCGSSSVWNCSGWSFEMACIFAIALALQPCSARRCYTVLTRAYALLAHRSASRFVDRFYFFVVVDFYVCVPIEAFAASGSVPPGPDAERLNELWFDFLLHPRFWASFGSFSFRSFERFVVEISWGRTYASNVTSESILYLFREIACVEFYSQRWATEFSCCWESKARDENLRHDCKWLFVRVCRNLRWG